MDLIYKLLEIVWDGVKYLFPLLAPAAFSVLVGAFLIQKFFIRRSNESLFIDRLVQNLKEVSGLSLEYWHCKPTDAEQKRNRHMVAQKLKGDLKALSADIAYYCCRYCTKEQAVFTGMLAELHDACTGGSFESTSQTVDDGRYLIVINTANRLRSHLYQRKL